MTAVKLIYSALVVISGVFVILYIDSLSLLLFLSVLIIPVLLFLMLLIARLSMKVWVEPPQTVATMGENVPLKIHIKNRSFIPLTSVRVRIEFENCYAGGLNKTEIALPVYAFTNQIAVCNINSPHTGRVKINIKDMVLNDYFRLFSLKIKIKKVEEICFIPAFQPVNMEVRINTLLNEESDVFSKTKKGDDPSEVFAIRDYVPGDKLNRIHWKLSSKSDNLMVKDYSLPISNNILILPELMLPNKETSLDAIDTVLGTVATLSAYFCGCETNHFIGWTDQISGEFINYEVKELPDLYAVLGRILNCASKEKSASLSYVASQGTRYSHLAYVSAVADSEVVCLLEDMPVGTYYTLFSVTDTPEEALENNRFSLRPVGYHNVSDALSGISL